MRAYTVEYKEHYAGSVNRITILANSKVDAYDKAVYEAIHPIPYSAWIAGVTYQNGNHKEFNTFEGNPY